MNKGAIFIFGSFLFFYQLHADFPESNDVQLPCSYVEFVMPADSLILEIFVNKCNTCHLKKKQVVYTISNVSIYKALIKEQVIVKQRMPKGKNNQLTDSEKLLIQSWTSSGEQ